MLKKFTHAMLVSGLLLTPIGASANNPHPDQSDAVNYGIQVVKADSRSPFPAESVVVDYRINVAA